MTVSSQQQAAEIYNYCRRSPLALQVATQRKVAEALDAARADEAARWKAKIEALAGKLDRTLAVPSYVGDDLRALVAEVAPQHAEPEGQRG